jgi:hypothetical protein
MSTPRLASLLLLALLPACQADPEAGAYDSIPVETIHDSITSLRTDDAGVTWVGFGAMARSFAILAGDRDLAARARAAHATGRKVHATVRAGHGDKSPTAMAQPIDPRRVAVLRLSGG